MIVEDGVVGCRALPWRWFSPSTYFSAVSQRICSIEECKEITSLIGVLCMKRRKMKALFKSFLKEEEEED
jgi:hypothetical protein